MNKKLENLLQNVIKPSRYTGGEFNCIYKDKDEIDVRVAFCFPDTYEVGMSHLGSRILYGLYNSLDGVWCERCFAPWIDMEEEMKKADMPLYALESGDSLKEFDVICFTLQYEMSYTNILNMLSLADVPLLAKDRTTLKNMVWTGGPCAYNPEPIADFVDLVMLGDGEEVSVELIDLYKKAQKENWSKDEFLNEASKLAGVYVPSLYTVEYNEDNTVKAIAATGDAPAFVEKRVVIDLDTMYYPDKFVVPSTDIVFDRAMVELFRGCPRGCRFCQAGHTYRPLRKKSPEVLLEQAKKLIESSGFEEISLSSLSTSDYGDLEKLTNDMIDYCDNKFVSLSLPSLRADNFSVDLMEKVQKVRKSGLTFAPEAGSQRMRDVINKNLTEDDLLNACSLAFKGGWSSVKLYFMIGLPTETMEDLDGIADLARKVAYAWKLNTTNKQRGVKVTVSTSSFVPKPQTPFQWCKQDLKEDLIEKQKHLKVILKTKNVSYSWHQSEVSFLEGVFARGDRRLGKVLLSAFEKGCKFDGWDECFKFDAWLEAFSENGIDPYFYTSRERNLQEVFPWDHLGCGSSKDHLIREYKKAIVAETTPDCVTKCSGCTANKLLCGGECHV